MFRLLNVNGRSALQRHDRWFDLADVSGDDSLADPLTAVARHHELHAWAERCSGAGQPLDGATLGPPVPNPRQVFGIGLNYRDHAAETGATLPPVPLTFTKFPTCIIGPHATIALSGPMVDWEVEIVVVIGRRTQRVPVTDAWSAVAGLTLGQDISDRQVQRAGTPPQFSLGKSFASYGPTGPALVSVDGFDDPDDVALWCEVNGERMQDSRTSQLVFTVPVLVAYLSSICTLEAGDLIFTGTPAGVGMGRGRFLGPGDRLVSGADVIGELANDCIAGDGPLPLPE